MSLLKHASITKALFIGVAASAMILAFQYFGGGFETSSLGSHAPDVPDSTKTPAPTSAAPMLFKEEFDPSPASIDSVFAIQNLEAVSNSQTGESYLRASYVPSDTGSVRILGHKLLNAVERATLHYSVFFESDFEFVRTGKLHGLGPINTTAGCDEIERDGWSARVTFHPAGGVALYIYDQLRPRPCGNTYLASDFQFQRERWYQVSLFVEVNSAGNNDGVAALYIDGQCLVQRNGIKFRDAISDDTLINKLMINTFHGGNDPTYSPTKTVYARFDNFVVTEGKDSSGFTDCVASQIVP